MANLIEQLEWNERFGQWEGHLAFPSGRVVEVSVSESDEPIYSSLNTQETLDAVQASASDLLSWLQQNERKVHEIIAADFVTSYNENQNDEPPISVGELANRIRLTSIWFHWDQTFNLSFSDGGMFGGHMIQSWFDENRQLENTDLWG